jgi:hypothetical protein
MDTQQHKEFVSLARQWRPGYVDAPVHNDVRPRERCLDAGAVYIMGQHGEIGRGYYAKAIRAAELDEDRYEEHLVKRLSRKMPPFLRSELRQAVVDVIRSAYRQADKYSVEGHLRLDFLYLYERTRRWASGSLSSQTGLVFAPFLNPDYIRASFGYPQRLHETNPFHKHIIAANSPDWMNVPYDVDLRQQERPRQGPDIREHAGGEAVSLGSWKQPRGNRNYDNSLYWALVGKRLIDEAVSDTGFLSQVFDIDVARRRWDASPDIIAIVYLLTRTLQGADDELQKCPSSVASLSSAAAS